MKQTMKTTFAALGLGLASIFLAPVPLVQAAEAEPAQAARNEPQAKPAAVSAGLTDRDREAIGFTVGAYVFALSNGVPKLLRAQLAPSIQKAFDDPIVLMLSLARAHAPVALAGEFQLDGLTMVGAVPVQHSYVVDNRNRRWHVSFAMLKHKDGSWRIASCFIIPAPGILV